MVLFAPSSECLPYWQVSALDALVAFLADDSRHRLELVLCQPHHSLVFAHVLQRCGAGTGSGTGTGTGTGASGVAGIAAVGAESALSKLQQLVVRLPRLARALGECDAFVAALLRLLCRAGQPAIVRKPLLGVLEALFERQCGGAGGLAGALGTVALARRHGVVAALRAVALEDASSLIVVDLADSLVGAIEGAERAAVAAMSGGRAALDAWLADE